MHESQTVGYDEDIQNNGQASRSGWSAAMHQPTRLQAELFISGHRLSRSHADLAVELEIHLIFETGGISSKPNTTETESVPHLKANNEILGLFIQYP